MFFLQAAKELVCETEALFQQGLDIIDQTVDLKHNGGSFYGSVIEPKHHVIPVAFIIRFFYFFELFPSSNVWITILLPFLPATLW